MCTETQLNQGHNDGNCWLCLGCGLLVITCWIAAVFVSCLILHHEIAKELQLYNFHGSNSKFRMFKMSNVQKFYLTTITLVKMQNVKYIIIQLTLYKKLKL